MALPVIKGVKSPNERFAGAEDTYCIEALMQDGKALQAGTSHFLGQNFAKAFDVKFTDRNNQLDYVWATSWGVSTRLIGALVMAHSDDDGLILPPKIAPVQVVIVPIYKGEEQKATIDATVHTLVQQLKALGISVKYDDSDTARPGWKFAEYEMKGVPVRVAIGARDIENGVVEIARRDTKEKNTVSLQGVDAHIAQLLKDIQQGMYDKAKAFRDAHISSADTWDAFVQLLDEKGGFVSAHWDGTAETEEKIKELTKATIRCIPLDNPQEAGACILTGNPSVQRVLFARAY
jgi:prolyl-tRNA synthetase